MRTFRIYHVLADRSLQYRCTVVAANKEAARLRAKAKHTVDGRRRLALIDANGYSELAPGT
jgi:hypothetical protein